MVATAFFIFGYVTALVSTTVIVVALMFRSPTVEEDHDL